MFELVTGGSGSGKSAYAEDRICALHKQEKGTDLKYIATMFPYGNGTEEKIADHRLRRKGKGFDTIECYTGLLQKARVMWPAAENQKTKGTGHSLDSPCILLECVSNLVANELYMEEGAREQTVEAIVSGILYLKQICRHLVVVTNEVFSDSFSYDKEMRHYQKVMGEINKRLAAASDQVTEVVYGSRIVQKGKMREMTEKQGIRLIIGGAFQGKKEYAKRHCPEIEKWTDGENCSFEELKSFEGMEHFHIFIRRWMEAGREKEELLEQIKERSERGESIVIISDEIGYGLVPVDAFERQYRECVGRIMTDLAKIAVRVDRVICGMGQTIKEETC